MTGPLQVLGIIPARAGSKRLPRKNIRLLGGKPLLAWTIEAARQSRRLRQLVVSSDDPAALAIAADYDPALALERPATLAGDESLAIDFVRHALKILETNGAGPFSAVAILQPSSPFTIAADIDATVNLLAESGADSAVTVVQLDHAVHPWKMKTLDGDRLLPYLVAEEGRMAAHELPTIYVRNCSVYVTRREAIERGQVIGEDCRGYVMPRERSLDINDEFDWELAEFLMARKRAGASC